MTTAGRLPNKTDAFPTAGEIMRTDVVTISASAPLSEVERILSENRISGAPVTDEAGHIIGVLSMRDLIERYAQDPDARPRRGRGFYELSGDDLEEDFETFELPAEAEETAADVMTAQVHTVRREASLVEVAERMVALQVHRILVTDQGRHIGLVSTFDVLRGLVTAASGDKPAGQRRQK